MFLNTEAEVAGVGEVVCVELELLDLLTNVNQKTSVVSSSQAERASTGKECNATASQKIPTDQWKTRLTYSQASSISGETYTETELEEAEGLLATDGGEAGDLLVTTNTERTDGVTGLGEHWGLLGQALQHLNAAET